MERSLRSPRRYSAPNLSQVLLFYILTCLGISAEAAVTSLQTHLTFCLTWKDGHSTVNPCLRSLIVKLGCGAVAMKALKQRYDEINGQDSLLPTKDLEPTQNILTAHALRAGDC